MKEIGGRDRDRTGDPLLAKHETRLQQFHRESQLLTFPTNRGICFRSKANPNELKTFDSCTLRAQHKHSVNSRESNLIVSCRSQRGRAEEWERRVLRT